MKTRSIQFTTLPFAVALFAALSSTSGASTYDVYASISSSAGGVSTVSTVTLSLGDAFSVSASPTDLWSMGPLPRWCNANGLTGLRFATGSDESGQPAGTLIGTNNFGLWTQNGFSAPFGALVGRIGTDYMLLGTSYSGTAPSSGVLELMCWDVSGVDNSEKITALVTVPEPSMPLLTLAGGMWVLLRRIRRTT